MKRIVLLMVSLVWGLLLCACHFHKEYVQEEGEKEKSVPAEVVPVEKSEEVSGGMVSLFLPIDASGVWTTDARMLKEALEEKGYDVSPHFARDGVEQKEQILHALEAETPRGVLIAPAEPQGWEEILYKVQETGIAIVAYEELPMDTSWVDAYVTSDYYNTGKLLGEYIRTEINIDELRQRHERKTIEIFPGRRGDVNRHMAYIGLWEVLEPYLEEGVLVARSGVSSFEQAALRKDTASAAFGACESLLQKEYQKRNLDIVCTFSDTEAAGVQRALKKDGYQIAVPDKEDLPKKSWPFWVNIGYGKENAGRIRTGWQQAVYERDGENLAKEGARVLDMYIRGENTEENAVLLYDNGKKIVPAYVCPMIFTDYKKQEAANEERK